MFEKEPIMNVIWIDANDLVSNEWNPNTVLNPELKLLEKSILDIGWIQPIQIRKAEGGKYEIIDGFHRVMLARDSKKLKSKYKGKVPCVMIDVTDDKAKVITVRTNKAKGIHQAKLMHGIVKSLIDEHGYSENEVMEELGMSRKEVKRLYDSDVYKILGLDKYKYSNAWTVVKNE